MTTEQLDKAQVELKRIVDLFSTKELPTLIKKVLLEENDKPSNKWSLSNKLIMLTHETTDARTFNQWNQVDRRIKKGSKGFWIIAPNIYTIKEIDEKTGKETTKQIMKGFVPSKYAEFRAEDTEGKPIEYVKNQPKQYPQLSEVAKKLGASIKYDVTSHGEYGSFNPSNNEIRLCTAEESTFFHELAHLAHKQIDKNLKVEQDPEQETIAELSACVLASLYNMNIEKESWTYIESYSKEKGIDGVSKLCMKVLNKVDAILKLILE